jgi:thiol-disulfide isomerase/thioredoxin
MRQSLFIFCLFAYFHTYSAVKLSGRVTLKDNWKRVLYVAELYSYECVFSGSIQCIVDSVEIDHNGCFRYDNLKENTAYRITSSPIFLGDDISPVSVFIQDGNEDNYFFFLTGQSDDSMFFKGNLDQLYLTGKLYVSGGKAIVLNEQLDDFRKLKLPVFELMRTISENTERGEGTFDRMGAIKAVTAVNDSSNLVLDKILTKTVNPDVFAIGMVFRGIDFLNSNLSSHFLDYANKQFSGRNGEQLLNSIIAKLKHNINNDHVSPQFLMEEYQRIDGSKFSFIELFQETRLIVIDFWASWCIPCRISIRNELKELSKTFGKEKLMVIGVNLDQDKFKALEAIKYDKNEFLQLIDEPDSKFRKQFDLDKLPFYLVVDTREQSIVPFRKITDILPYIEKKGL